MGAQVYISQTRQIHFGCNGFPNNYVQTTKYSILSFLPKAVLFQFTRLSNVIFLINAILSSLPTISSLSPFTAIGPLLFVLLVSLLRQGYEDYKRYKKDKEVNEQPSHRMIDATITQVQWQRICVGDVVYVKEGQMIPADLLLLNTSDQNKICYVETANLDGENNLKEKRCVDYEVEQQDYQSIQFCVEGPHADLHLFKGQMRKQSFKQSIKLNCSNLLLRQTVLRNTSYIWGIALYCGKQTKLHLNQGFVHHKMSQLQSRLNRIHIVFFLLLLLCCLICSIGYYTTFISSNLSVSYVPLPDSLLFSSILIFFTTLLYLNFLIPISLNIFLQGIKTISGVFLSLDIKMQDEQSGRGCGVLNSSILQELGCIDYVLTDKTGTLTVNEMVFKHIIIDSIYPIDSVPDTAAAKALWLSLALCHDLIRGQAGYQGSSPDEVCFVTYAQKMGYEFMRRTKHTIVLRINQELVEYERLDLLPFGARRRMSVVVRVRGTIMIYCKGADSTMLSRGVALRDNVDAVAKLGLRTLVFGCRVMDEGEYRRYVERKRQISEEQFMEEVERGFTILGATAIEDRLQEMVPQTIDRLQEGGIKVMMVTGDKLQTAENIGFLAGVIRPHFHVYRIPENCVDMRGIAQGIVLANVQCSVIIEGGSIDALLRDVSNRGIYVQMLRVVTSAIFCRSSPREKAQIVRFVKQELGGVVLAIGDGGNDVSMIEQAHVGVAILGKEGNGAAVVSDFNFSQFRFLDRIVLHHGRWFYSRFSFFFVYLSWKNFFLTFLIFFFEIDCLYSGQLNITQLFYLTFNTLFGMAYCINSGLFDQDFNDDHSALTAYKLLPSLYKQNKNKSLFSYGRFTVWMVGGIIPAAIIYYFLRSMFYHTSSLSLGGQTINMEAFKALSAMLVLIVINVVGYTNTKMHTVFSWLFFTLLCTIGVIVVFILIENYDRNIFVEINFAYSDIMVLPSTWLILFATFAITYLFNVAVQTYHLEEYGRVGSDQFTQQQ